MGSAVGTEWCGMLRQSRVAFSLVLVALPAPLMAANVRSPNQRVTVTAEVKEKLEPYPAGRRLYYSVAFDGKVILRDSPFRLDFKGMPPIAKDLAIRSEKRQTINETWEPVWGTHSRIANHANELVLSLEETGSPNRKLEFVVRVFDDGAGFRYALPAQPGIRGFKLAAERSEFHFTGNETVWTADYGSFAGHQETEFNKITLSQIKPGDIILTGTPHGVGKFRDPPRFLSDGDRIVVEIEGIGRLANTCRAV